MLLGGRLEVEATFELFSLSGRYAELQGELTADDLLGEEDAASFDESAPDFDMGFWELCDDWASQVDEQSGRSFNTWRLRVVLHVKDYPALYPCVLQDLKAIRTERACREAVAEQIGKAQRADVVLQGICLELAQVRVQLLELEKREAARKAVVAGECLEQYKEHVVGALTCLSEADFNGCVSNPSMLPILESFEELED